MKCLKIRFAIVMSLLICGCGFGKQAQLNDYVASEKPNLPKVLFDNVKVVDMATGESEIVYFCDALALDAADAVDAKSQMLKKAERYAKTNQHALQRLIDARIKMTFVARNNAGDEVFRFSINPWER